MEAQTESPPTPTQVLIHCLEDFGQDEPLEVIVIYRTSGGDLAWSSNLSPDSHFIGMLRMAEFHFFERRKNRGG